LFCFRVFFFFCLSGNPNLVLLFLTIWNPNLVFFVSYHLNPTHDLCKVMWQIYPSYCNCVKEEVSLSSFEILLKQIIFLLNNPTRSVWGSISANMSSYVFYASERNKHMMLLCVLVKRNVVMFLSHIDSALRLYCHYKSSFLWASELNSSPPILGVNSILLGWTRRSKDLHPSNGGGLVICTSQHLGLQKSGCY
jgi:hypothetical protein